MSPPADQRRPTRRHFAVWALLWIVFVVYGSLVPLTYRPVPLDEAIERFTHLPPLWYGLGARADWVANILLFIPLAFLWMAVVTLDRSRLTRLCAAAAIIPTGFAAAVALEFAQIWFPRTVSRNDIVAESIGTVVGVAAWLAVGQAFVTWLRAFATDVSQPSQIRWLLQAWLLGFVAYSVLPLDLTISVTELFHKYESGQVLVIPFSHPYKSAADLAYQTATDIVAFMPVGAWLALTFTSWRPVVVGFVGGGGAAALELVQLFVLSRYTDVTDVFLGLIGAWLGGLIVARGRNQRPERLGERSGQRVIGPALVSLAMIAAFSLFLVAGFCFPPEFTRDRILIRSRAEMFFRVPLLSLYLGSEFHATSQLFIRLLFFAPLGVLWARVANFASSPVTRRLILVFGLLYSATLATGIEVVQILMPAKVADVTDSVLCTFGAAGGLYLANRFSSAGRGNKDRH